VGKAENAITRTVRAWLTMHGALVVRVQAGVIRSGDHFVHGAQAGTADLIGCMRGWPIAVEVKTPTGRMQASQVQFAERWRATGGIYLVARGIDDLAGLLDLTDRSAVH
jgi:hypothetical protein